jgi:hypothetical protein
MRNVMESWAIVPSPALPLLMRAQVLEHRKDVDPCGPLIVVVPCPAADALAECVCTGSVHAYSIAFASGYRQQCGSRVYRAYGAMDALN